MFFNNIYTLNRNNNLTPHLIINHQVLKLTGFLASNIKKKSIFAH